MAKQSDTKPTGGADPYRYNAPGDEDAIEPDETKLTGACDRCRSGERPTAAYVVKGSHREFCEPCAQITAASHKITPTPPAQEAHAAQGDEAATADPPNADAAKADAGRE